MKTSLDWSALADLAATHWSALWVVAATVVGAGALGSLVAPASFLTGAPAPTLSHPSAAEITHYPLTLGTVMRAVDGDTYDIMLDQTGEVARVRLAWVDAPERDQPYGAEAGAWAKETLGGKQVVLSVQDVDSYGRLIAQLTVKDERHMWDVAATMARCGIAWLDPRFGADRESLREGQELASTEKIGIWSDPDPIPPWAWRNASHQQPETYPNRASAKNILAGLSN